jgi:hypothetical protein
VSGSTAQEIDPAALGAAFPRTHHILQLEFGDRRDFDDPRRKWRRLFSELLGTFALVLVAHTSRAPAATTTSIRTACKMRFCHCWITMDPAVVAAGPRP